MPTSIDPITIIGLVASVVVSWYLIREVIGWSYGVIRQKQWGKFLNILAVVLWFLSQSFILVTLFQYPRTEVKETIPLFFPVLVITPGEGDETYKAQMLFYKDLGDFINKNPKYTYLVPEGEDGHLKKTLHGGIAVKKLSDGRQSLEVRHAVHSEAWCNGWYDATDKEIFPKYHNCMHGLGLTFMYLPFLAISTFIIYWIYKLLDKKIGSQQRPNKQATT